MEGNEGLGEIHLLGGVEGREIARVDRAPDGLIDLRMAIAEDVRADAHEPDVEVGPIVEIPHRAP